MNDEMVLEWVGWAIIIYMLTANLIYLALFSIAGPKINREKKLNRLEQIEGMSINKDTYPISVLVPAFNEETGIASTVQSLLSLNYPQFEVVVINDGSTDSTSAVLIKRFQMQPIDLAARSYFKIETMIQAFQSQLHPHLFLLEKKNGGKADALNAGINFSQYP